MVTWIVRSSRKFTIIFRCWWCSVSVCLWQLWMESSDGFYPHFGNPSTNGMSI